MIPSPGRWLTLGILLLVLTGCGENRRQSAEQSLRTIGPAFLRREAALLYKELFVTSSGQYFVPKIEQWPTSFRHLEPLRVRAYPDGFSLALLDGRTGEEGLYVVPAGMDNQPREGPNARFQKIDEGIYWYAFPN